MPAVPATIIVSVYTINKITPNFIPNLVYEYIFKNVYIDDIIC